MLGVYHYGSIWNVSLLYHFTLHESLVYVTLATSSPIQKFVL